MPKAQHASRYRHFPGMLRAMREEAGLTQRELAKKLRTNDVFVHKSEIGERRVDVMEFLDWCIACDKSPERTLRQLRAARGI